MEKYNIYFGDKNIGNCILDYIKGDTLVLSFFQLRKNSLVDIFTCGAPSVKGQKMSFHLEHELAGFKTIYHHAWITAYGSMSFSSDIQDEYVLLDIVECQAEYREIKGLN